MNFFNDFSLIKLCGGVMSENVCKSLVYTNDLFYCVGNESILKKTV